jgi:hypothetical protein
VRRYVYHVSTVDRRWTGTTRHALRDLDASGLAAGDLARARLRQRRLELRRMALPLVVLLALAVAGVFGGRADAAIVPQRGDGGR